jgi:hypothetical protein
MIYALIGVAVVAFVCRKVWNNYGSKGLRDLIKLHMRPRYDADNFDQFRYRIGDTLPPDFPGLIELFGTYYPPSWARQRAYSGREACSQCQGTGRLMAMEPFPANGRPSVLTEICCRYCGGTGNAKKQHEIGLDPRRWAPISIWDGYKQALKIVNQWLNYWLTPQNPVGGTDKTIANLQQWRIWIGFAVVLSVTIHFSGSFDSGTNQFLDSLITAPLLKALIALPCFLVSLLIILSVVPEDYRLTVLKRTWASTYRVLVVGVGGFLFFWGTSVWGEHDTGSLLSFVFVLVFFVFGLPFTLLIYFKSQVLAVKNCFNAADCHPLLSATVSGGVGMFGIAVGLFSLVGRPADIASDAQSVMQVIGAVVVVLLSLYEIERWKRRGITWRSVF